MPFSVAVAGASGYAGGELLRLLDGHPDFEVRTVTAHQSAGASVASVHPNLRSCAAFRFAPTSAAVLADHDVVFLALPHGRSGQLAEELNSARLVIDAGADHRLVDESDWARFYGGEWHGWWPYGLPELPLPTDDGGRAQQRSLLTGSDRIAVPGCNVTAVSLALAPGFASGLLLPDVVAVLAVGPSGAGRVLKTELLASELLGSAHAYAVGGVHRHTPEIRQNLSRAAGLPAASVRVSLTPVLVPMARGILATASAPLRPGASAEAVREAWQEAYAGEDFVQLLPEGEFPRSGDTVGSNVASIGLAVDRAAHRVITVTALDNLVKGTAGAAIQAANLALGLPESTGLSRNGVAP